MNQALHKVEAVSGELQAEQIHNALTNVLSDDKFLASPQMSAFLSYVVHETMAGKADRIKAYTVAVDALGKPSSFDPQNDPSVRVLANRLRTSLNNFYTNNPDQALFIELYRGSYVPHFIDATGREHVQEPINNAQPAVNDMLQPQYTRLDNVYRTSTEAVHEPTSRQPKERAVDSVNRVNSWLMGGGKKYG